MSDKIKLIKEEIEKELTVLDKTSVYDTGRASELNHLLLFIDSLLEEPASEDLNGEYDNYFKKYEMDIVLNPYSNCKDIAHHFAEWQREKDVKLEKIDDLEEFAQKWSYSNYHKELDGVNCDCLYSGVKKGAEWQKQQMKEALQTEYEKGRFDMMEEMMKNAVELTITNTSFIPLPKLDIKAGDKAKIIIIKT